MKRRIVPRRFRVREVPPTLEERIAWGGTVRLLLDAIDEGPVWDASDLPVPAKSWLDELVEAGLVARPGSGRPTYTLTDRGESLLWTLREAADEPGPDAG